VGIEPAASVDARDGMVENSRTITAKAAVSFLDVFQIPIVH
jgi:hypothetical protein